MYMMMFVLDDPTQLDSVLDSWAKLGVTGATIVESTGLYRRQKQRIPMRYLYSEPNLTETGNTVLFAVVENEPMVQACLAAAEAIVGDLDGPNTGIFSAWPLAITKGVPSKNVAG